MGDRIRRGRRRGRATQECVLLVALFLSIGTIETSAAAPSVPSAPTGVSAVPGNAQATVSWTAPASNGSAITGYVVTPYVGTTGQSPRTFASTATTQTVTGLTNGTTYTFKIAATDANSAGQQKVATNLVTVGAPAQPTGLSAVPGNAEAAVMWTAPVDNGSAITGYVVTPYIGATAQPPHSFASTATTEIVTGLTNATTYTFKIAA